jgi:hypothetical protein
VEFLGALKNLQIFQAGGVHAPLFCTHRANKPTDSSLRLTAAFD